ncbi:SCO family protein [Sphingomonas glaciei]|uniref:SCO family protein n=1 Tax=Sphingomonas glaciei TaxID=2938948 RepID=A0ABY5N137_9SPHN|nr:SCO family protein [Sphingomonas glaciei]UUR09018.1 SCO family protein [Sphingomonas glaciei]
MATEAPASKLKVLRLVLWSLVGLAALAFAWLLLIRPEGLTVTSRADPGMPGFTIGAPFTLTGATGKPFNSAQALAGRPYAMFFGFTNCPDVCPNTLGKLAKLRGQLDKGDQAFDIVFVSVDPGRDTPKVVGDYVQLFGTPIIGLTGTEEQVAAVAKSHAIYQARVPDKAAPGGYTVDHGSQVLLFGRDGKFVSTIAQEEADAPALDKLRRIVA